MDNLFLSLITGLVAGWVAGLFYKGSGFGMFGNIIVGLVGSILGGYLAELLSFTPDSWISNVLVSAAGAIVLLVVLNLFTKGKKD